MALTTPQLADPQSMVRTLGETLAVISAGPWFSAVTSAAFADAAHEAREGGAREVVLDLTAVRAVDATGTATLAALAEHLDVVGCQMAVATTHPGLVAWLEEAPLDVDLPVHETADDAIAELLRRPV